ncbi:RnfABCDGE type electron transport complex subunit D [Floccifex sp.]|uniref:RnfABCDGE type electron transport complex subunit D n=1 Tax=Floccifex sp. TaxID=2815810 RepID=UPI002A753B6B|nr:RnfABCDGE type electron transport complex subunit D [Floccifex sp.]MDD7281137.1 RnfABCDGE type electron transport complex subunit D [Erysipelotrichaceae bacterium]MDY2958063.1 RnfABCDGE type electron transport complex subunit D [Floccifex sp.]
MKFNFHVSPNLKAKQTTQKIMRDLTIGLLVVFVASVVYYATSWSGRYAMQCVILLVSSLVTTLVCEAVFAKIMKQNILKSLKNSFGWITSLILVMMVPINTQVYAIIVSTAFAIIFGKLLFGGFGQNIFNPAAVGRATIFAAFSGATTNLFTGATPTATIASTYNWMPSTASALDAFLGQFGGFGGLAIGTYPGAIGETFTLLILVVGIVLCLRNVIDWRVPVMYLGTIFVMTAVIAVLSGFESYHGIPSFIWYPLLHLLTGGVAFGAVFMLTDPVTSPTSASGRTLFAMGAAILTVLIRVTANLPEGCLYSILLMNMFTPMIESALDGKQLEVKKKAIKGFICFAILGLAVSVFASASVKPVSVASNTTTIVEQEETI